MQNANSLIQAAMAVDVMDAAGRIIANPHRHAPEATAAQVLALAWAAEGLNAIAIEAELLVRAVKLPMTGNDVDEDARDHAIQTQIDTLERQFALLRAPTQTEKEGTNGNDAG